MNTKTKTLVVLAFVVAAFYALEVVLTLLNQGLVGPVFVKVGIVVACLYYAINQIVKSKGDKSPGGK